MPKKPPSELQIAVSARLNAIQKELGKNDTQMAKLVGVGRTTWGNWVNAENMPEEAAVIRLCDATGMNLEWLYRGNGQIMPASLLIRLELRLAGLDPDKATPAQKEPVAARVAALASP